MSPEEREKKRRWMMEYNRRRKASAAKATQPDLDALNAIYGTRFRHGQQVIVRDIDIPLSVQNGAHGYG